eukprot:scaffold33374_cov53-Prasinocladus_malaysianus.AAC.1
MSDAIQCAMQNSPSLEWCDCQLGSTEQAYTVSVRVMAAFNATFNRPLQCSVCKANLLGFGSVVAVCFHGGLDRNRVTGMKRAADFG